MFQSLLSHLHKLQNAHLPGLALTVEQFHALAERVRKAGVKFIIEPHLRFKGAPGEQWTMFFKDPR